MERVAEYIAKKKEAERVLSVCGGNPVSAAASIDVKGAFTVQPAEAPSLLLVADFLDI